MLIYVVCFFVVEVVSMVKLNLREFVQSDIGAYGVGLPLFGGAVTAGLMAMGLPATAAGPVGLFAGATVIGLLRGVSGAEPTRGMTSMELRTAAGISALVTALTWAAGQFGNVQPAQAVMKAAEEVAEGAAGGANNVVGSAFFGALTFAITAFSMTLGSIAWGELIADWAGGRR